MQHINQPVLDRTHRVISLLTFHPWIVHPRMMVMKISIKHFVGLGRLSIPIYFYTGGCFQDAYSMGRLVTYPRHPRLLNYMQCTILHYTCAFLYSQPIFWYCFSKLVLCMKSTAFLVYGRYYQLPRLWQILSSRRLLRACTLKRFPVLVPLSTLWASLSRNTIPPRVLSSLKDSAPAVKVEILLN